MIGTIPVFDNIIKFFKVRIFISPYFTLVRTIIIYTGRVALWSLIEASEVRIGSKSVLDVFVVLVGSWMLLIRLCVEIISRKMCV